MVELQELIEMEGIEATSNFSALSPQQVNIVREAAGFDPLPLPEGESESNESAESNSEETPEAEAESTSEAEAQPEPAAPEAESSEEAAEQTEEAPVQEEAAESEAAEAPAEDATPAEEEAAPAEAEAEAEPEPEAEAEAEPEEEPEEEEEQPIIVDGDIIIKDLAVVLDVKPNVIIASLMKMGIFASINQPVNKKIAQRAAKAQGIDILIERPKPPPPPEPEPEPEPEVPEPSSASESKAPAKAQLPPEKTKKKSNKKKKKKKGKGADHDDSTSLRPPVVTFMGHVDHGKTSLLDKIRNANVVDGEAGSITQHIGAYTVETGGKEITFLDTPGHAAFTAMRKRGANLTDIVVIVISAEESLKPQTIEAIKHAQEADVELMVAINKVDLPNANPDRVKQELQQRDLTPEDWGGETICVNVSAKTGEGLDELLEMILLQAEVLELEAPPNLPAEGYVIESQMEKGMGPTASVLVTQGTLNPRDVVICGESFGKLKALIDDKGQRVKSATPSHAVKLLGLNDLPSPGDKFEVIGDEKEARQLSLERKEERRQEELQGPARNASLDDLFAAAGLDDVEELPVLLKGDVKGSQEAIISSLEEIKSDKVRLKFIGKGIGPINENDVLLAGASGALILGFNVNIENAAVKAAKANGTEIRLYDVIYELIDEVEAAMTGLLKPVVEERVIGHAEIRVMFKLRKGNNVAGCIVTNGRMRVKARARVMRGRDMIYQGGIATLRRFQDDVQEVGNGQECGIRLENFNEFEVGDTIEVYLTESVSQGL